MNERLGRKIAAAMNAVPVLHYGDEAWSQFLTDHGLTEDTEIAFIDGRGEVVGLSSSANEGGEG